MGMAVETRAEQGCKRRISNCTGKRRAKGEETGKTEEGSAGQLAVAKRGVRSDLDFVEGSNAD